METNPAPVTSHAGGEKQPLSFQMPGFDGKVTPTIGEGIVISMDILADHVTDLSPLRALPNLSYLECYGSPLRQGKLVDLSPLQGLTLSRVMVASPEPFGGRAAWDRYRYSSSD